MTKNKKWTSSAIAAALLSLTSAYASAQTHKPFFPSPPMGAVAPIQPRGSEIPPVPVRPGKRTACAAYLDMRVAIDNDWLARNVDVNAQAANDNTVSMAIYNSYLKDGTLYCHYRSANQDIRDLAYRIPCRNGFRARDAGGYAHVWICQ